MNHVSYSEFRAHLARYMNEVCHSRDALVVTRQKARSVVVLAESEFNSIMETLYLVRNPANALHLLRVMEEADAGKFKQHQPIGKKKRRAA